MMRVVAVKTRRSDRVLLKKTTRGPWLSTGGDLGLFQIQKKRAFVPNPHLLSPPDRSQVGGGPDGFGKRRRRHDGRQLICLTSLRKG